MHNPTKQQLEKAQGAQPWDIGNQALYNLCEKYPLHTNESEIIGKVWLIGRSYAAAIERHKLGKLPADQQGDGFYFNRVGPEMVKALLDIKMESLKGETKPTEANAAKILEVHEILTKIFQGISGLRNISLASKYLHFHFPELFFIYDSRAVKGISAFEKSTIKKAELFENTDEKYCKFFIRCLRFRDIIEKTYGNFLSPRELDNLLLG